MTQFVEQTLKVGFWGNLALLVVMPGIISVPGIAGLFYLCVKASLMILNCKMENKTLLINPNYYSFAPILGGISEIKG